MGRKHSRRGLGGWGDGWEVGWGQDTYFLHDLESTAHVVILQNRPIVVQDCQVGPEENTFRK